LDFNDTCTIILTAADFLSGPVEGLHRQVLTVAIASSVIPFRSAFMTLMWRARPSWSTVISNTTRFCVSICGSCATMGWRMYDKIRATRKTRKGLENVSRVEFTLTQVITVLVSYRDALNFESRTEK
jgi:hypothetical protein